MLNEPEAFDGYTLYVPGHTTNAYLLDNHGRVVLKRPLADGGFLVKLLDNGNVLADGNREIDPQGNVVWNYRLHQHHDLLKMPNGNVLILSREYVPREEAAALGAHPDLLTCGSLGGAHIVEVRPTGPSSAEVVWEWSVFDHLIQDYDAGKPNYGVVADHPERIDLNFSHANRACESSHQAGQMTHANALDYNAELDQIMITIRRFSEFWIVDHSATTQEAAGSIGGKAGRGGDLLYRWGNPRAYGAGTPADQRLFFPHAAHWIPDGSPGAGNILIFNNGEEFPGFQRGYSSVDEVALPSDYYRRIPPPPAEIVWAYAADPPGSFYASHRSFAQRLPNGHTLITDGHAGRIFEVTQEGETVWDFVNPPPYTEEFLYRAYRYPPRHPGLQGLDPTPWRTAYRAAAASESRARSLFDLYLVDGDLIYVKEQCVADDVADRFFLHVVPERRDDLPATRRGHGFDKLDFDFFWEGTLFDGKCAARVPLPAYPIASVRTGQFVTGEWEFDWLRRYIAGIRRGRFVEGEGELWSAEFAIGDWLPALPSIGTSR